VVSVQVTTQGTGSTLNSSGGRTSNLYDHILVHDKQATAEMIGAPEVVDVRSVAADDKAFYDTVSDHLPIVVRLRASGPDDD
jgi:ABC-type tungstate transport system permease subunit